MTNKQTKFWSVSFTHRDTGEQWTLIAQAPEAYDAERIEKVLSEVNPEYEDLRVCEIDRPDHIKAWGDEDTIPPPPCDPELDSL